VGNRLTSIACVVALLVGLDVTSQIKCQVCLSVDRAPAGLFNAPLLCPPGLDFDGFRQSSAEGFILSERFLINTQLFPLLELELALLLIVIRV
jgi:hypothetical protein